VKIAIVGSGKMGAGLGKLWAAKGHKIFYFDSTASKSSSAANSSRNATHGTISEAAKFGDVIFLAVPYLSVYEALEPIISSNQVENKILIDCTNPLSNDLGSLLVGHNISAAEEIAGLFPKKMNVKVVKAFNTIGSPVLESGKTQFGRDKAAVFYCGNDKKAKAATVRLIKDAGFEPVDSGPLTSARFLEPMAALIIRISMAQKGASDIAFKLLKR
jgi:predicted dinucleotide-binding enzyme